jgi:twinkle protein
MGKIILADQPCINPNCSSSDARQIYEAGDSFCFSCETFFPKDAKEAEAAKGKVKMIEVDKSKDKLKRISTYPIKGFPSRKITRGVNEFYGVRVSFDDNGAPEAHYYPYDKGQTYKIRYLPKTFSWVTMSSSLFGMEHFNSGGRRLIICEGEIDTLSVAQASYDRYQKFYPIVGIASSSMTKSLLEHRDWIRSFEEVILCFDNDSAGEKALREALKIVGTDKAKMAKLNAGDANDVLREQDSQTLLQAIFDASPYIPSGIIGKEEIWEQIVESQNQISIPYPDCVRGLNYKTKGMRGGSISLFISGTGSGKSTMMKENVLHLIKFQDELEELIRIKNSKLEEGQKEIKSYQIKVGVVSLEEPPAESGKILASMVLYRNLAKEEISLKDLRIGFEEVFLEDRVMLLDHQGSMNDASIIEKLEYMILSGCTHLIIDHITILVSEGAEGLSGNEAQDKVMNDLLRLVTKYPHVWIGLISHLRKSQGGKPFEEGKMPTIDDIKGSGSIKQVSFDIIAFCRNMVAESEDERNHINMSVLKCRHTGLTGPVPGTFYNYDTGRLVFIEDVIQKSNFVTVDAEATEVTEKAEEFKLLEESAEGGL